MKERMWKCLTETSSFYTKNKKQKTPLPLSFSLSLPPSLHLSFLSASQPFNPTTSIVMFFSAFLTISYTKVIANFHPQTMYLNHVILTSSLLLLPPTFKVPFIYSTAAVITLPLDPPPQPWNLIPRAPLSCYHRLPLPTSLSQPFHLSMLLVCFEIFT